MPRTAMELFDREMDRVNAEAGALLDRAVKGNASAFLKANRKRIEGDVRTMYSEFHPERHLDDRVVEAILDELEQRLSRTDREDFLARVVSRPVQFAPIGTSRWESSWGDAVVLLKAIAELPRRILANAGSWRDNGVSLEEVRQAMNVCRDQAFFVRRDPGTIRDAKTDLELIEAIADSDVDDRTKCELLFGVVDGVERKTLEARLAAAVKDLGNAA